MNTPTTSTVNAYTTDHYFAASAWMKTIEKMGKVESVEPNVTRTTITMCYLDTLSMHEMLDLAGTCCLFGVRYHISTAMKEHRLTVVIH